MIRPTIDLRSDTVTRPTAAMYDAMRSAPLGDDVYGEDPTVNAFQEEMAALFGKEAGLFVPTGVLGNQLAIKALTQPGDEVIVEAESHIFNYETAAPSMMSAVQLHTIRGEGGVLDCSDVVEALRPEEYYYPRTSLVCLENTHNRYGGALYDLSAMHEVAEVCKARAIFLHLDGARIWNAHVATGISFEEYGRAVDTLCVCFSKGLGAPIGSMLLASRTVIDRAHRFRKIYGGGMRQTGLLAAAARHGFHEHLPLLRQDHERARRFAALLAPLASARVDPSSVQTNMVLIDFAESRHSPDNVIGTLREQGILIGRGRGATLRAVFHIDLRDEDVDTAAHVISTTLEQE
jgi:threonine aldolase